MIKRWLKNKIQEHYPDMEFDILTPPGSKMGDYSVNLAFILAKKNGTSPAEEGKKIVEKFLADREFTDRFGSVEFVAPGFVNFFFKKEFLHKQLTEIYKQRDSFGTSDVGNGKTVIVEYSSPNIAKPMHIGHLRSTIIGDALANIYEALGYKVIRWNYIGDWGTQFGKLIAGYKHWGNKNKDSFSFAEGLEWYIRANKELPEEEGRIEFKKLEEENTENRNIWQKLKNISLAYFQEVYKELGVSNFDEWKGESDYESKLKPLIEELQRKGLAKESEGALIIELNNLPPAMLRKSDGATLYMTRDLASLEDRIRNYHANKILYVVANQQTLHFEQLFAIAKMLGFKEAKLTHVKFGMVLGEDGKKLATREGKVVPLQEVMDKVITLALKVVQDKTSKLSQAEASAIAQAVGIGALKYNDLKQHPYSDIVFDWDVMLDFSGNSGPYLQYTYARLANILEKAENRKEGDASLLVEPEEGKVIKRLLEFPEAIEKCAELNTLNGLALYLYELANDTNRFYENVRVLDDDNVERLNARLVLIESVAAVLERGLNILGIKTLKRI